MGVLVVGLGGIGSALVEPLARYLNYNGGPKEIALVDGDSYEKKNLDRQRASVSELHRNKALAHAERLKLDFKGLSVTWLGEYVTVENISGLVKSGDVVFACVDNHSTRKLLQEHCLRLKDILLISGGNELTDGNILIFHKKNGRQVTQRIDKYHPEIAFPADLHPGEASCDELAAQGSEQVIFTNFMASALMLNAYYGITQHKAKYSEVVFDILENRAIERR